MVKFIPSNSLEEELLKISSEVRFDPISRTVYSQDASIYEVLPLGVIIPKSLEDLKTTLRIANRHGVSITPRGAATGITGGCLGSGLILDTSKYLNRILEIDYENQTATVEPGVIQDDLNAVLAKNHFRLGPDTSTGDRATLGGMAANNSAGARSLFFGKMIDAVLEVNLVLSNGEQIHLKELTEAEWNAKLTLNNFEGDIYRAISKVCTEYKEEIKTHFPKIPRRASGYQLDELLKNSPPNLAKLIVGSEGTLGVISSLKVAIAPTLKDLELHLFAFDSMSDAMEAVAPLLKESPIALEMIDDKILRAGKAAPSLRGKLAWLTEIPKVLLIAEFQPPHQNTLLKNPRQILTSESEMKELWALRKAGLGLLLSKRSYSRAVAFIEDLSIPPENLKTFMAEFLSYLKKKGKDAGIYGHVGPGCLHIRPYMDLRDPKEMLLLKEMMLDVTEMVKSAHGALSGEHGDGLIRSWLNETLFGTKIIEAFHLIKEAFDPRGIMNPHKIVEPLPVLHDLRKPPKSDPTTFLKFKGGIALAADLCNGNGACRKKEGVMCPSFQVTRDESDSTRARANLLRSVMQEGKGDLSDPALQKILDLCIGCKGCLSDCPSEVDMARMKSETLYQFQEKFGYSLRNRFLAHFDTISKWMHPLRALFNHIPAQLLSILRIGYAPPKLSHKKLSTLYQEIKQPSGTPVYLLSDTYSEYYCPEVAISAIQVLNRLGFFVHLIPYTCCGRAALSKGFLKVAKGKAEALLEMLPDNPDVPIIGLEPSCLYTLLDEYHDLLGDRWNLKNCMLFDSFIAKQDLKDFVYPKTKVALHGHCHQKALYGMQDTLKVLKSLPGVECVEIPSGCCGMAGSFGYESEHVAFSKKIGELKLIPFIQNTSDETHIIANGFSCRAQIERMTKRKPLHLAEFLSTW